MSVGKIRLITVWAANAKDSDPMPAAELSQHLLVRNFAFSASPVVGLAACSTSEEHQYHQYHSDRQPNPQN
jgi:hypothetical protein